MAEKRRVVSCLEVGPRYLHSTGQLQKGGPNCGVFLILSADELKDIPLKEEAESLGSLAKAQASGDLVTLASRGRRCVHLHLPTTRASPCARWRKWCATSWKSCSRRNAPRLNG